MKQSKESELIKTKKYFNLLVNHLKLKENAVEAKFFFEIDLSRINTYIPTRNSLTLVDIGCGLAPYSLTLQDKFDKIVLIDLSPHLLQAINKDDFLNKEIMLINTDASKIDCLNLYNVDLALLTGSVLCYQENMLADILTKIKKTLRKGGIIYGDVWNKNGLVFKNWYFKQFPKLSWKKLNMDQRAIIDFINHGTTEEVVDKLEKYIFAYSYNDILNCILKSGYSNYHIFGRKTLSLFLTPKEFARSVGQSYENTFELELRLSQKLELASVSPKLSFLIINM